MDIFNSWLVERYIAHRGFYNENAPENSLSAFKNAIKFAYPIELDVQQIEDGTIIVFHDMSLQRLTGKDGYTKNLVKKDLKNLRINNTENHIPTLEEALDFIAGQVPVLIEIKNINKVGEMERAIWDILKNYNGEYAVQSFNPFSLEWFKNNAPKVLRGQLASFFKGENIAFYKKYFLKRMYFNKKVSQPHFIAYDAKSLPNRYVSKYKSLPLLAWTIRSQEEYMRVLPHCDNIIFENFEPKL
jgi:glycerophosphoryl diester phosphodiesterase